MYERHEHEDRHAPEPARARPLPAAFDDLLERLARAADERRALQQALGQAD